MLKRIKYPWKIELKFFTFWNFLQSQQPQRQRVKKESFSLLLEENVNNKIRLALSSAQIPPIPASYVGCI